MCVVHVVNLVHTTLLQVLKVFWLGNAQLLCHGLIGTCTQLVEDVEAPLSIIERVNTRLLQQEVGDLSTQWLSTSRELDLNVLPL